jgi:hypothetical protein
MISVFLCIALLGGSLFAQDPLEIVRRSVELDQNDWEQSKNYTYIERVRFTERDSKGAVKKVHSNASEVLFLYGEQYERKIEKDGKPLPEKDRLKEQERLDKFLKERAEESEEKRRKREEKRAKERAKEREFAREIPEAFTFELQGEEVVNGHRTWVVGATPKPGFKPRTSGAGMLSKFQGKLWIDQASYRWVKMEMDAIETVSYGWVVARLAKGTRVELQQTRVNDEVWLPKSVSVRLDARVALLKRLQGDVEVSYGEYRKFQSESKIVSTSEVVQQQ